MMAQVLAKEYECLTCHTPIKIAKLDNVSPGQKKQWERFETDGTTPHQCKKKEKNKETGHLSGTVSASVDNGPPLPLQHPLSHPQIAELSKKVETLESKIDTLIAQIQMLRGELRKT